MRQTTGTDLGLTLVLGGAALALVLWAGAALSAVVAGHHAPGLDLMAGFVAFAHPGEPSLAWGVPVGPAPLYWSLSALVLGTALACALGAWRVVRGSLGASGRRRPPHLREGIATRSEVRAAAGARTLERRATTLRPSLERPSTADLGYRLGTSRGVACWASVEDSMLLVGPPRSGKGMQVVIPMLLDAPGAVVTTSTRPDNLAVTLAARAKRGPVMVFDPERLAGDVGVSTLAWPLTRGCEDPRVAIRRAEALVADAKGSGVENASFWRTQAVSAVRTMLHAAALGEHSAADLFRWSHSATSAREALSVLTSHAAAAPGWDRALDAIVSADQRTRDAIWAMVANTFSPLADPGVLGALSPAPGQVLDPATFLAEHGTAYLIGTASGAAPTAAFVAALVEDLVDSARRLAAASPGQRLDPPLALVLDEAANYPLPSLPSLMSEGGGSGITTLAVLQSLAQARDRWGREAAGAIWDAAIVKLVLGGSANADDLADLSRLIGDVEVLQRSESVAGDGSRSYSTSQQTRPLLEPSEIRRLGVGTGLLLLRSAPPILLTLRPWTARADAQALRAARVAWEARATSAAGCPSGA